MCAVLRTSFLDSRRSTAAVLEPLVSEAFFAYDIHGLRNFVKKHFQYRELRKPEAQRGDAPNLPIELDLEEHLQSAKKEAASLRIEELQSAAIPTHGLASPSDRSRHVDRGLAQNASGCADDRRKFAVRHAGSLARSQLRNSA